MSVASRAGVLAVCVAFLAATARAADPSPAAPATAGDSAARPAPRPGAARTTRRPPPALILVPLGLGLLLPLTLPTAVPRERRAAEDGARSADAAPAQTAARDPAR